MSLVTPIIMTAGRPDSAVRQALRALSHFEHIVIASGDTPGTVERTLRERGTCTKRILVVERIDFIDRFLDSLSFVDTPFVAMVPDDDDLVPQTALRIANLLNEDGHACMGAGSWQFGHQRLVKGPQRTPQRGGIEDVFLTEMPDLTSWNFQPEFYWGIFSKSLIHSVFLRAAAGKDAICANAPNLSRISTWRVFELSVVILMQAYGRSVFSTQTQFRKENRRTVASRLDRWSGLYELEQLIGGPSGDSLVANWHRAVLAYSPEPLHSGEGVQIDWAARALLCWGRQASPRRWAESCRWRMAPVVQRVAASCQKMPGIRTVT